MKFENRNLNKVFRVISLNEEKKYTEHKALQ